MYPKILLDRFYEGPQEDASVFLQQLSNSRRCIAPGLVKLLEGRDRPLGKSGACGQLRDLAGFEDFTSLSIPVQAEGRPLKSVQDAVDHYFRWEDVDFGIDCHPDCPGRALNSQRRHRL